MRRDWALLGIGAFFVLVGLVTLPNQGAQALATVPFFAAMAGVGVWNIVRKKRTARLDGVRVQVVDGVPLRPSRLRAAGLGGLLLAIGLPFAAVAQSGIVMQVLGGLVACVGVALLAGVALRWWPSGDLLFSREGLTFGFRGYTALVPWQEVAGVVTGEFSDNAYVGIGIFNLDNVVLTPPEAAPRFVRTVADCRALYRSDLALMSGRYGVQALVLAAAIQDRLPHRLPRN